MTSIRKQRSKNPKPPPSSTALVGYKLRLYIAGTSPRSSRSVMNIRSICQKFLLGRYDLEIIDIYQQPTLAREHQIIAAPTLIKEFPLPLRTLVGDFSDRERVLSGLGLTFGTI
jgi:circadian clock protein KaiB